MPDCAIPRLVHRRAGGTRNVHPHNVLARRAKSGSLWQMECTFLVAFSH